MGQLLDMFVQWAKREKRWPLLCLLAIPAVIASTQQYFELSFRDTIRHGISWILCGGVVLVSGILYWAVVPSRTSRIWPSGALAFLGALFITGGAWQLQAPTLPEGKFVVGIAKFTPISSVAKDEAENLPHRIEQMLQEKIRDGVPLVTERLSVQVTGADEKSRHEAAMRLGRSKSGNAHLILWGEVRRDEGELYVSFRLTAGKPWRGISTGEERRGEAVTYEGNQLDFKQHLSSEIADLVTMLCGLADYKAGKWDEAISTLDPASSDEASLYRALSRIRKYRETYRNTLDSTSLLPELVRADTELTSSFEGFVSRNNFNSAVVSLINRGNIRRFQGRWVQAIDLYKQAYDSHRKGQRYFTQGKGSGGVGKS